MNISQIPQLNSDSLESPPMSFVLPFGARLESKGGAYFRIWAPDADTVELVLNSDAPVNMACQSDGWAELLLPKAKAGDLYWFRINGELMVPDPTSRYQPQTVHGQSQIIDPQAFQWQDTQWQGLPWEETVIYEMHVGTFTLAGTYQAAIEKLDYLKDLGITAIELMPVAQCPGARNWGYDGVLPFAPANQYGTPDDLKILIQAAHEKGLMVFLDVVYNHFGPEGNYLHAYAERFFTDRYKTPWGAAIDFHHKPVREYFIYNALYWLNEFHFDGLRFDAVHAIKDESTAHFLTELAERIRAGIAPNRYVHLMLENDDNQASFLSGTEKAYNAQWNDDFHHAAHVALTGEASGYYEDYAAETSPKPALAYLARCLTAGYAYQEEPSPYRKNSVRGEKSDHLPLTAFVNFLQNHDQIGNRAFGDRLSTLAEVKPMRAMLTALLLSPTIPMVFMGEEWQSRTPFQFFCDFGPELGPLVTEGRRKEFGSFEEFSDPDNQNRIPDPCQRLAFETSKLDWDDLDKAPFQEALAFTKELLKTRHAVIVPLIKASHTSSDGSKKAFTIFVKKEGLLIGWALSHDETLVLALNASNTPLTFETLPFKAALSTDKEKLATLILESESGAYESLLHNRLPAYTAVYMKVPSWKP